MVRYKGRNYLNIKKKILLKDQLQKNLFENVLTRKGHKFSYRLIILPRMGLAVNRFRQIFMLRKDEFD